MTFDVIVIGAGHAGCEAAFAAARLGARVGLVTLRRDRIAEMSCNPAIGGVAKGHLVRELDAMGGVMGQVIDVTGIQFRRLNQSRGPAVRSTRAQADSRRYREVMTERLQNEPAITLVEGEAVGFLTERGTLSGVQLKGGAPLRAPAVVVTTGTFLNGLCHIGEEQFGGGRMGDIAALSLSDALSGLGIELQRFKTGTTPRLDRASVRFDDLEVQPPELPAPKFSFDVLENVLPQVPCHITYTSERTAQIVRDNLHRSPLYRGIIRGLGPRYCPSLEDKFVRFSDKERHQIFLEPEGLESDRIYPNGLSTSLPRDVQEAFLHSIAGLEQARVLQYGYAVEYDYAPPTQLFPSLMTKVLPGLFLAGQLNGTSGYEEAAAQGLMAGINAVRFLAQQEPAVLGRHEAYIGVLIDDLVTKGVDEPYRMFTSRAEHRLLLRESNAEERLLDVATAWGVLPQGRIVAAQTRRQARRTLRARLEAEPALVSKLRRPEVRLVDLISGVDPEVASPVEEDIKYQGYIERERRDVARLLELDAARLPATEILLGSGLSREIEEKLRRIRPTTLGQASRIPGMTPAALALLRIRARAS